MADSDQAHEAKYESTKLEQSSESDTASESEFEEEEVEVDSDDECLEHSRKSDQSIYENLCISPAEVRFTHDQISSCFRESREQLDDIIDRVKAAHLSFDDFPHLVCVRHKDAIYSLSNRRLFVARVLHVLGHLFVITIQLMPMEDSSIQRIMDGKTKWERSYSTKTDGAYVRVKSAYRWLQSFDMARAQKKQERGEQSMRLKRELRIAKEVCQHARDACNLAETNRTLAVCRLSVESQQSSGRKKKDVDRDRAAAESYLLEAARELKAAKLKAKESDAALEAVKERLRISKPKAVADLHTYFDPAPRLSEVSNKSKHVRIYFQGGGDPKKAVWHLQETLNTGVMDQVAAQHDLAWEIRGEKEGAGVFCWPVKPTDADLERGYAAMKELVNRRFAMARSGGKLIKCSASLHSVIASDEKSRRELDKQRTLAKNARGRGRR